MSDVDLALVYIPSFHSALPVFVTMTTLTFENLRELNKKVLSMIFIVLMHDISIWTTRHHTRLFHCVRV